MPKTRFHFLTATAVLFLSTVTGCGRQNGPELGLVEGVIRIDDQPASLVMIEFQPVGAGGSPSIATADAEGRYKLRFTQHRDGAMIGSHTIRITYNDDPSPDWPAHPIQIPAKYNTNSELMAEVKPGKNRHSFELKLDHEGIQTARN